MVLMAPANSSVPTPPPPPSIPLQSGDVELYFTVRSPWQWTMAEKGEMKEVPTPSDLPTAKLPKHTDANGGGISSAATPATPATRRRIQAAKKASVASCTLRLEVFSKKTGKVLQAVHGTSSALDGLEDKDELVRTIQRCRCEHLHLSPPSVLIKWDVTKEECMNVVGTELPTLVGPGEHSKMAVLKEPMGSQGTGIFFVKSAEEIHEIVEKNRKRAIEAGPEFLDNIIDQKGRIPSWVLQAEVYPARLIRGGRKFHIRSYIVVLEKPHHPELLEAFVFNRHEVRIASVAVNPEEKDSRDRLSHITNGALSDVTERVMMHNVPELTERQMQPKVELFVAQLFGKHFVPDMVRRVRFTVNQEDDSNSQVRKFAIAGLDIMVTEDDRLYLLEVNVGPSAPPEQTVEGEFKEHLVGFMSDLVTLVLGQPSPNFVPTQVILQRNGQAA